jgi:predicted ATPase
MRLRYVALPEYGPLRDLRIAFGRETLLPGRMGTLNFVVGVNGTGKSHLFRALFEVFRHLESGKLPPFAASLVYDHEGGNSRTANKQTVVFDYDPSNRDRSFFANISLQKHDRTTSEWHQWLTILRQAVAEDIALEKTGKTESPKLAQIYEATGVKEIGLISTEGIESGTGKVGAYLPSSVIAYTSGSLAEWEKLSTVWMPEDVLPEHFESPDLYDERSADWTTRHEIINADADWRDEALPDEERQKFRTGLLQRESPNGICRLIGSQEIQLAATALGVWQAAQDFRTHNSETQRDAFRLAERQALAKQERGTGARRLFRSVDWLWATHLSLVLDPAQRIPQFATDEMWFCLHVLADRVMQLPNGLRQFVIQLAPNERADLQNSFPAWFQEMNNQPSALSAFMTNTAGSMSGAETLVRLFSGTNLEAGLLPFFNALREWRREGFLESASVTVRRISRDEVLCLESFSDGEQMLLGRSALLFLLQKQPDGFLLLDEPETHFNDAWKRKIVDWVDEYVLSETPAQILISTHTSIALTDAFAQEIAVFQKPEESSVILSVTGGTFGTDPSEIMTNVFGAESGTGSRSLRRLDALLKYPWSVHEIEKLEQILTTLGSSFHRAELRAKLAELKQQQNQDHGAA